MPEARAFRRKAEALWREVESWIERGHRELAFVSLAGLYDAIAALPGDDQRTWLARIAAVEMDDTTADALKARIDGTVDRLNQVCSSGNLISEEVALTYTLYQELEQLKALLEARGRGYLADLGRLEPDALRWVGRRRSTAF